MKKTTITAGLAMLATLALTACAEGGDSAEPEDDEPAVAEVEETEVRDEAVDSDSDDLDDMQEPTENDDESDEDIVSAGGLVDPDDYATTDVNGLGEERWTFTTPSLHDSCVIRPGYTGVPGEQILHCQITRPGMPEPILTEEGGFFWQGTDTSFGVTADPRPVLEYDDILQVNDIECTVDEEAGILCSVSEAWMRASGDGIDFSAEISNPDAP